MIKKTFAISTGIVLSLLSIAPANAVVVDGVTWSIDADSLTSVSGGDYGSQGLDGSEFHISTHGADNFFKFLCEGTETTEPDGDAVADCGAFTASGVTGIEWTGHVKVFGADGNGGYVARQVVSLKNTTAADIVIDYWYSLDTEETYDDGDGEGTTGTPDGDLIVEEGETWWAGINNDDALEGIAFGTDGYARGDDGDESADEGFGVLADDTIIDESGLDEFYLWNDAGVTVPAGATINFVYFYASVGAADWGSTAPGAYTDVQFNLGMSSFSNAASVLADPRLMEGIVGGVHNWGAVPPAVLAETGVDASGIAVGGALALVAGAGVYAVRRRRALV